MSILKYYDPGRGHKQSKSCGTFKLFIIDAYSVGEGGGGNNQLTNNSY